MADKGINNIARIKIDRYELRKILPFNHHNRIRYYKRIFCGLTARDKIEVPIIHKERFLMDMRMPIILVMLAILQGCASSSAPVNGKMVPTQNDANSLNQLIKTDLDRLADIELRETTASLRLLMTKLYKRNPIYLKKSTSDNVDKMVEWVFEGNHGWNFDSLNNSKDIEAIYLAFNPSFEGDRVLALIVGMQTMMMKARGNKTEFFITDSVDPQSVYNSARNLEIVAWRLANTRDDSGRLYFLSNEIPVDKEQNLSFEREIGKMIGRTDLYAEVIAEKAQRGLTNFTQGIASKFLLPIGMPFAR